MKLTTIFVIFTFGFILLYLYHSIYSLFLSPFIGIFTYINNIIFTNNNINIPQDIIQDSMKTWETQLKNFIQYRSQLTYFNQQMKDRIGIAREEMNDKDYEQWKTFVEKGQDIYIEIEKCSQLFHHIYNKHKMITDHWNNVISTDIHSKQFLTIFENNIKEIRKISKKEKEDVEKLRINLDKIFWDMNKLQDHGNKDILTYKELIRISQEGWTIQDMFKAYGPASFGWLIPAKLINISPLAPMLTYITGPAAIATFGLLGVGSAMVYHYNDYKFIQPQKRTKFESLMNRTQIGVSIVRLTQEYISQHQNDIDLLDLKLSKVLLNSNKIKNPQFFIDFIKDVDKNIDSLNDQFKHILNQKIDISERKIDQIDNNSNILKIEN
jgi:hypothetical protein